MIGEAHPLLLGERTDELFRFLDGFDVRRLSETADAISFIAARPTTTSTECGIS